MHRANALLSFALTVSFAAAATLSSCRTSQQEARRANAARVGSGNVASAHEVDSLLMVEDKLIEVIDSMTNLVGADHERIRALEQQVQMLEGRTMGTPVPPNDPPPSIQPSYSQPPYTPPPVPSVTAPTSLQERYSAALQLYNSNEFESALTAFQSLEKDDPHGAYAGNYKYWEGECDYAEHDYNMALQAFGAVVESYPNSTKAAAAQFKLGECYERLHIPQSAHAAYERVLADYPNSEFRARAQARLKALR